MNNLKDVYVSIEETTKVETIDLTSLCFLVCGSAVEIKPLRVYDNTYREQLKKLKEENPVMGDLIDFAEEKLQIAFSTQANLRKGTVLIGFSKDGAKEYPNSYGEMTSAIFKDSYYKAGNTNAKFVIKLAKDGVGTVDYSAKNSENKDVSETGIKVNWTQTASNLTVTFPKVDKTQFILKLKRVPNDTSFIDEYNVIYSLPTAYSFHQEKQDWGEFFKEREVKNEKFFGFLGILTPVKKMVGYFDLLEFCNGQINPIFLCNHIEMEEIENIVKNEFNILFMHKQQLGGKEVSGMLMETALPILCYKLANNPNINTFTTLQGVFPLSNNSYSTLEREKIEKAHVNQYVTRNGLTRFRLGFTTSGRKIEEIFCIKSYIPYDMKERLEVFQENTTLRQGDAHKFRIVLGSILSSYEEMQILTKTKLLNNSAYEITTIDTKVVDGLAEFEASIKISYNGNIVNINITGKEIEVVL